MRTGFWLPWWLWPLYALVWAFLIAPVRLVIAIANAPRRRRERQQQLTVRVRVNIQERENPPAQPEG